eukprot:COSAG04_NODE_805_length_10154_cov_9.105122_14_plen_165_part_00
MGQVHLAARGKYSRLVGKRGRRGKCACAPQAAPPHDQPCALDRNRGRSIAGGGPIRRPALQLPNISSDTPKLCHNMANFQSESFRTCHASVSSSDSACDSPDAPEFPGIEDAPVHSRHQAFVSEDIIISKSSSETEKISVGFVPERCRDASLPSASIRCSVSPI